MIINGWTLLCRQEICIYFMSTPNISQIDITFGTLWEVLIVRKL